MQIGLAELLKQKFWVKSDPYYGQVPIDREDVVPKMIDVEKLRALLFHEFSHPLDMNNPNFKYSKCAVLSWAQSHVVMNLWNTSIDGRLTRSGIPTVFNLGERAIEAIKMLRFLKVEGDGAKILSVLKEVWDSNFISHPEMIEIARQNIPFKFDDQHSQSQENR